MCTCGFLTCGRGAAGSDPGWCCRRWRLELGWSCIRPPLPLLFLLSETVAAVVGQPWFPKVWKPWQHTHTHTISSSLTHTRLSGGVCLIGLHFSKSSGCPGPYSVAGPPYASAAGIESLHASPQSQYTWGKKGTRHKIKGDVSGDRGILSKPTIRRPVGGGMSHSPVC